MPNFEDFNMEQLITSIRYLCMYNDVFARQALEAIKSPSTIDELVTDKDLRELLKEWHSKSQGDANASQRLRDLLKTRLPQRSSHFMREIPYPGNPAGFCDSIAKIWLRAQLYPPSDSLHPKILFYKASSAMPDTVNPQWKGDWMRAMERHRLLPPDAMNPNFQWSCENVFPDKRVFCIQPCLWQSFPRVIVRLINDLRTHRLNGFIHISSETVYHVMAATVKIREGYISFKFFDPNALDGEQIISLPLSQPESWEKRILDLIQGATELLRIQPDADCTIVCLLHGAPFPSSLNITNWEEIQLMSHEQRTCCLYDGLTIGGEREDYFNYVKHLIDDIPPIYLGMFVNNRTALFVAAQYGYEAVVDIILKAALRLPPHHTKLLLRPRPNGATALLVAAKNGHKRVVEIILNVLPSLPPELAQRLLQPYNGETALYFAAKNGHKRVVEIILSVLPSLSRELAQLLLQPHNGETALNVAAYKGRDGVVDAILNAIFIFRLEPEFSQCLVQPTPNGTTALVMAILNKYERVVEIILNALPKLPRKVAQSLLQPRQGVSPVDIAQERGCSLSITTKLRSLMEEFKDI